MEEEMKKEEAPVGEPKEEVTEEAKGETCECCCSTEETKSAEDMIKDIVTFVNVKKGEAVEGATNRIEADTATELLAMLEEVAKKVGDICH
ncbi:MAG: hypothetical protein ABIA37_03360 [Candidatus Woesearchaeota archaeon]